jgi:hypothetical protein
VERTKLIRSAATIVVLAVIIAIAWPKEREPVYHGKKLSEWLRIYRSPIHNGDNKLEAKEAVQQIGTNAIPWLLKWIATRPPIWSRAVGDFRASWNPANRVIDALQKRPARIAEMRWEAAFGFEILGETASNAVPSLLQMLDTDNPARQWPSPMWPPPAYALARIGNRGLRPLLVWVSDPRSFERNEIGVATTARALGLMGWTGTNADLVISILVQGLCSSNKSLAFSSALGLGSMNPEPEIIVPALRHAAKAGNGSSVSVYLRCLGRTQSSQDRTREILLELQNDPDLAIQKEARSSLDRMASETATTNRLSNAKE